MAWFKSAIKYIFAMAKGNKSKEKESKDTPNDATKKNTTETAPVTEEKKPEVKPITRAV